MDNQQQAVMLAIYLTSMLRAYERKWRSSPTNMTMTERLQVTWNQQAE